MMNDLIQERLGEFKVDLGLLSPLQVVRKHVIHGNCCVRSHGQYLDLRCEVAERFDLHPNEVLVVGSAKLGFSIALPELLTFADDAFTHNSMAPATATQRPL